MNGTPAVKSPPLRGRDALRSWFDEGARKGYRVMLVLMDQFDALRDDDFGVYRVCFASMEEARSHAAANLATTPEDARDRLMEVFDLEGDFDAQFRKEPREGVARFWGQVN